VEPQLSRTGRRSEAPTLRAMKAGNAPPTLDIASAEAAEGGEPASLDIGPVEYKRGMRVSKTRLADEIGYLRSQQGPEPLANYIPSSQNGSRVPRKVQNRRKPFRNSEVERKAG
jgi:hypothetical protein